MKMRTRLRWFLAFAVVSTVLSAAGIVSAGDDSLEGRLTPLIKAHKGEVSVAVKNLETGEAFLFHENVPMPTASLIKFPVMIEAYRQAKEGKVKLDKILTLKKEDKVPGSGILTSHFSDGATFSLRDAVRMMIVFSDNTATNLVVNEIGLPSTAATMETMGCPNTKLHSKVYRRDTSIFPERSKQFGLGSTTAAEMLRLCEALDKKEVVSKEASEAMIDHLKACDDADKFPRFLPPGTKVAFKTGSVDASRTAAGIVYTKAGPVAVCVMTNNNEDKRWIADNAGNRLCADVAKEVFEYFDAKAKAKDKAKEKPKGPVAPSAASPASKAASK